MQQKNCCYGEATHNSHQEQVSRSKIIKKLIEECSFTYILLEASKPSIEKVDSLINSKKDRESIRKELALSYQLPWIWKTDEFIDLLLWIRDYNLTNPNKANILGIDPRNALRDSLMAVKADSIIRSKPANKAILLAHNVHISNQHILNHDRIGKYLKDIYGESYFSIGQIFGKGSFFGFNPEKMEFDTAKVMKDISKLSKNLDSAQFDKILITSEVNAFKKPIKVWNYGAIIPHNDYKEILRCRLSELFDAVIFHDKIHSASNLKKNGNLFIATTHEIKPDLNKGDSMEILISYNGSPGNIINFLFYHDKEFLSNFQISTDSIDNIKKKVPLDSSINSIKVRTLLFADTKLSISQCQIKTQDTILDIFSKENRIKTNLLSNKIHYTEQYSNEGYTINSLTK